MNKSLFAKSRAAAVNEAGGKAYTREPKNLLATLACTGTFGQTFYTTAETQLADILAAAAAVGPEFAGKCAVYARKSGHMKDTPAVLAAWVCAQGHPSAESVFKAVIDNGKMLRNFVQAVRSGALGRKSLGSRMKRLVQDWLNARHPAALFNDSLGNDPSLADVIKLAHPKPQDEERKALYGYLIGKTYSNAALPEIVRRFEGFKLSPTGEVPPVNFQFLSSLTLSPAQWRAVMEAASWTTLRMNLNTFARHGVFSLPGAAESAAAKLRDSEAIRRSKCFPYQLLAAYLNTEETGEEPVPRVVREALQDAMETATANVPAYPGAVWVCVDVSGSMRDPVTGSRGTATSRVRCVDVAALVASCVLRQSKQATILPFDTRVHPAPLNPRDSVMTNAKKLAAFGGGGTNCAVALAEINRQAAPADLVTFVSDNESWVDNVGYRGYTTNMLAEWQKLKKRQPQAKLVCIDMQPTATSQVTDRPDILQVAGWSDAVFDVIQSFSEARNWVRVIEES